MNRRSSPPSQQDNESRALTSMLAVFKRNVFPVPQLEPRLTCSQQPVSAWRFDKSCRLLFTYRGKLSMLLLVPAAGKTKGAERLSNVPGTTFRDVFLSARTSHAEQRSRTNRRSQIVNELQDIWYFQRFCVISCRLLDAPFIPPLEGPEYFC